MAKFDFHTFMANDIFMGNSLNKLKNSANKLNFFNEYEILHIPHLDNKKSFSRSFITYWVHNKA